MTRWDRRHTFDYTGLEAGLHSKHLENDPNLKELNWRLGTNEQFFSELLERLKITRPDGQLVPSPDQLKSLEVNGKLPRNLKALLANLVSDPTTDWAAALLNSWAILGDILCFYQERLINEGFIGTATQPQSLTLLNAMLGLDQGPAAISNDRLIGEYRFPGAAGSAEVVATVKGGKGMPGIVTIKENSVLRRVSPSGGDVLYFLVNKKTELRSEWNKLFAHTENSLTELEKAYFPSAGQNFLTVTKSLKPGGLIAVTGQHSGGPAWYLMEASSVRTDTAQKQTTIIWEKLAASIPEIAQPAQSAQTKKLEQGLTKPKFVSLSQNLGTYGKTAPLLSSEPLSRRMNYIASGGIEEWQPNPTENPGTVKASFNDGLPPYNVNDFMVTSGGQLYLATEKGVFFRNSATSPWTSAAQGLFKRSVRVLVEDTRGFVYAGTVGGGVYRSLAGSSSWSALPGGYIMQPGKIKNGPSLRTSLPATTVNKLALGDRIVPLSRKDASSQPLSKGIVVAATDNGIYQNDQSGTGWFNIPLDGAPTKKTSNSGAQPQSPTPVLDCALAVHHDQAYLIAVTDGILQVLEWPKNLKSPTKPVKKKPNAKGAGHGPAHIPNIFVIAFDGLLKILKGIWLPVEKTLKAIWVGVVKAYRAIKKFLEWVTHVDPQHWADIDLPYPGSKVKFSGKFVSLQFAEYPTQVAERKDDDKKKPLKTTPHSAMLAVSSSTGIFVFNSKTGKLVLCTTGLPKTKKPYAPLTNVANPSEQNGAILLTMLAGKVFGFIPTGGLNKDGIPAGRWKTILTMPAPADKPSKMPDLPSVALTGAGSSLYVIQPVEFMSEWPGFALGDAEGKLCQIDVTGLKGTVAPNAVGVLVNGENSHMTPFDINGSQTVTRRDFGTHATVTRLQVTAQGKSFDQQKYNRRSAKVLVGTKELFAALPTASNTATVGGASLQVAGLIAGLSKRRFSITGAPARALLLPVGGVQAWQLSPEPAKQLGAATLPLMDITALVSLSKTMIAALTPEGLWQAGTNLEWKQSTKGTDVGDTQAQQITLLEDGATILLTKQNLYRRSAPNNPWVKQSRPEGDAPLSFLYEIKAEPDQTEAEQKTANTKNPGKKASRKLLLGTAGGGLFESHDEGKSWNQVLWRGIPTDSYISAIAQNSTGEIFVGMDGDGLVWADAELTLWQSVPHPVALDNVSLIRSTTNSLVIANTEGDLFSLSVKKEQCLISGLSATPGRLPILDLVIDGKEWTAGLKGGGIIRSTDESKTWRAIPTGINNKVQALLKQADKWLVGTAPETLLLDHTLHQQYKLEILFKIPVANFAAQLDRGLVGTQFLAAFKQAKIKTPKSPSVEQVMAGVSWLLCEAPSEKPASKTVPSFLLYKDGNTLIICQNGPELPIVGQSQSDPSNPQEFSVAMGDGATAQIDGCPKDIITRPALKDDAHINHVGTVSSAKADESQNCTEVKLASPVPTLFDANTVTYSANILPLAQGQLVKDEILGDSNPLIAFQSFPLKTGQLVFERQSDDIVKPVLSVTVNGLAFQQVENFADAKPNERSYVLTLNHKGMATVTFDDCQDGALLAAGTGNIRATYRANMSAFNSNDAKAQYIFTEPPYGVSTIATPVLQKAPEPAKLPGAVKKAHTHFPNRLITYADFEVLAEGIAGISKSKLELVSYEGRKTIYLTVAAENAAPLPADDPKITATLAAVSSISIEPRLPIKILPATLRPFVLAATVILEDGLAPDIADQILYDAYHKLKSSFGFNAMAIGKSIQLVTAERLLKTIPLVANIKVSGLHFLDKPPSSHSLVAVAKPLDAGEGEDLIYLNSAPGSVSLKVENSAGKTLASASFPRQKQKGGNHQ